MPPLLIALLAILPIIAFDYLLGAPWPVKLGALGAGVALVAAARRAIIPRCARCGATEIRGGAPELLSARPLHATRSGRGDRRYKHNPTIYEFRHDLECAGCQNAWSEVTDSERRPTGAFADVLAGGCALFTAAIVVGSLFGWRVLSD